MSKRKHNAAVKARDAPTKQNRSVMLTSSMTGWDVLLGCGYKPLTSCPEVQTAIGV